VSETLLREMLVELRTVRAGQVRIETLLKQLRDGAPVDAMRTSSQADSRSESLEAFGRLLWAISAIEGDREWTIEQLLSDATDSRNGVEAISLRGLLQSEDIGISLVSEGTTQAKRQLGIYLRDRRAKTVDGLTLLRMRVSRNKAVVWKVTRALDRN
jgi:hypothetical protein